MERALFETWPGLREKVPCVELGEFPTRVESLVPVARAIGSTRDDLYVKRDDLCSPVYGGNKVRTLEVLFGRARARGATMIHATGAYGSNHAAATVLHAPRAGLRSGVVLFPQPVSATAVENLVVTLSTTDEVISTPMLALPLAMWRTSRACARRGVHTDVMVPGGATPLGALGYVSAALELAQQVARGELPSPAAIVVGAGSTCTAAGLVVGVHHAGRLGIGWSAATRPTVIAVRVTPWPVTAKFRIVGLAAATARFLAKLTGDEALAVPRRTLAAGLEVDGRQIGPGYGLSTPAGRAAIETFRALPGLELDTTYSGKIAAALLERARKGAPGPLVFWSTKSTAPLPPGRPDALAAAPARMKKYLAEARATGLL